MKNYWMFPLLGLTLIAPAAMAGQTADNGSVAMALYSQGSAVVQDSRTLKLEAGDQKLAWPVAGTVKPDTFWLSGKKVVLNGLEVSAKKDSTENLLADRVGHDVTVQAEDG